MNLDALAKDLTDLLLLGEEVRRALEETQKVGEEGTDKEVRNAD